LRKVLIAAAVVVVAGIAGFVFWQQYQSAPVAAGLAPAELNPINHPLAQAQPDDLVLGNADAPITLVEYSSLSCPHCARFQIDVLPQIKKDYIDTGKVKLVQRDFPLNKPAIQAAQFAHCVSPMVYHNIIDTLFKTQNQWLVQNAEEPLAQIAAAAGMDRAAFDACLANQDIQAKIVGSREAGTTAFGIDSTPTFIVNGVKVTGEAPYERFKELFDKLAPSGS
jgi:protein-disulfide isomerase